MLLLRGPQTAAELRTRTERMHPFGSVTEVEEALHSLGDREEPLVERLERQPGQKEARYADLLVGSRPVSSSVRTEIAPPPAPVVASEPQTDLAAEVAALRAEVASLRAEVTGLRAITAGAPRSDRPQIPQ